MIQKLFSALIRKKQKYDEEPNQLARVMKLIDLIALGVGSALGLGLYVLAGSLAKSTAGPATNLAFLMASVIALLAGVCYAEVAARVARAGYVYVYSYVAIGEFVAFIVGWNLIVGCMIGIASGASAISKHIDAMLNKEVESKLLNWLPINVPFLAPYPDFLATGVIIFLTTLLSVGMKGSKNFNNICTTLNLVTMLTAVVACLTKVDIKNWKISISDIDEKYREEAGEGGFLPFGFAGVLAAVPNCFFGFTGFEAPSTASEEAKNPKRDIPIAIMISLFVTLLSYLTISTVLTMVWPYYLQDKDAAFPHVFEELGWTTIKWVVTIGSTCALTTTMFGSMYTMPRVIYAMANDGLIFKSLSKVNSLTKTPLFATISSGSVSGVITTFIDLAQLVDFSTIGCLLSYTMVPTTALILRYRPTDNINSEVSSEEKKINPNANLLQKIFNFTNETVSTRETSYIANWSISLYIGCSILLGLLLNHGSTVLSNVVYFIFLSCIIVGLILLVTVMSRQPESDAKLYFKIPFAPFVPCTSVICNIYLMMKLSAVTWVGFVTWLVIGCVVYFSYGIGHSEENVNKQRISQERIPTDVAEGIVESREH